MSIFSKFFRGRSPASVRVLSGARRRTQPSHKPNQSFLLESCSCPIKIILGAVAVSPKEWRQITTPAPNPVFLAEWRGLFIASVSVLLGPLGTHGRAFLNRFKKMNQIENEFLSLREAAKFLSLRPIRVLELCRVGELDFLKGKDGKPLRISKSSILTGRRTTV